MVEIVGVVGRVKKKKSVSGERDDCDKGARPKEKCVGRSSGDGGAEVSGGDDSNVKRCMTKEKLDALCRHLEYGRGECILLCCC